MLTTTRFHPESPSTLTHRIRETCAPMEGPPLADSKTMTSLKRHVIVPAASTEMNQTFNDREAKRINMDRVRYIHAVDAVPVLDAVCFDDRGRGLEQHGPAKRDVAMSAGLRFALF
ncbi:MAG: hypothetical protein ACK5Q5_07025 [Planctomycetaceae bacterium]